MNMQLSQAELDEIDAENAAEIAEALAAREANIKKATEDEIAANLAADRAEYRASDFYIVMHSDLSASIKKTYDQLDDRCRSITD